MSLELAGILPLPHDQRQVRIGSLTCFPGDNIGQRVKGHIRYTLAGPISNGTPDEWLPTLGLLWHVVQCPQVMNLALSGEACSCTPGIRSDHHTHHNRLHDISPGSDIYRRVGIRIISMSTGDTLKVGLGFTVGFIRMAARARGIPRVEVVDKNARALRLILDKELKLKERPTAVSGSVGFSYRYPAADMLEIFQSNTAPGVFGFLDKAPGDNMSLISSKLRFFNRDHLAPCKLRGAFLSKRDLGNGITGVIKCLHGLFQRRVLSFIGRQFDLERGFHIEILFHQAYNAANLIKEWRFLPALKEGAFALEEG